MAGNGGSGTRKRAAAEWRNSWSAPGELPPNWPNGVRAAPQKVALAGRWRAETTMTLKGIAGELHRGSWTCISNLFGQKKAKSIKIVTLA